MNYFKNKAIKKISKYQKEIEFLHVFRSRQKKKYGEKFAESWLSVSIDYRISKLLFRKSILKRLFKI